MIHAEISVQQCTLDKRGWISNYDQILPRQAQASIWHWFIKVTTIKKKPVFVSVFPLMSIEIHFEADVKRENLASVELTKEYV